MGLVFSDFLNLFFFNRDEGFGAVIKALQSKGFFQSLAEPNLIAYNGQEASFLAGGEIPIPIVQGAGANSAVSVIYKEFGIKLNFTPTIAGDIIRLKVAPEVSTLDFANGITLQGFRIPALSTRRAIDERRAAGRPVVRDRRPARQPDAGRRGGHPVPEQDPHHRQSVQEQGGSGRAHRADGADYATAGAGARTRRSAAAAHASAALPAGARR